MAKITNPKDLIMLLLYAPGTSEADIKVTRDLIRAGQLLKIEVIDHVIIGKPNYSSLRELGYFYS
jgi:DNA repair protein RadC